LVAGRSRCRVTLCVVCTMHEEMRSVSFLVEPQNQGRWFISGFASKPLGRFIIGLASKPLGRFVSGLALKPLYGLSVVLASKPLGWFLLVWPQNRWRRFLLIWPQNRWLRVYWSGPQNWQLWFGDLGLKITTIVSWFGPQNHADYGLSVAP
jgi:hypothetical protein